MIGKGHPTSKENAKELRKNGATLFFAKDSNLLFAGEQDRWMPWPCCATRCATDEPTHSEKTSRCAPDGF
jgi:hypothetical protein